MKARVLPPGSLGSYLRRPTPPSPSPSSPPPSSPSSSSRRWSNPSWYSSSSSCCPHAPSPPPSSSPSAASCSTATCCWVDCATPAQSHTFNNRHRHSMQRKVERTVRQSAVLGSDGASSPPLLFIVGRHRDCCLRRHRRRDRRPRDHRPIRRHRHPAGTYGPGQRWS